MIRFLWLLLYIFALAPTSVLGRGDEGVREPISGNGPAISAPSEVPAVPVESRTNRLDHSGGGDTGPAPLRATATSSAGPLPEFTQPGGAHSADFPEGVRPFAERLPFDSTAPPLNRLVRRIL